MKTNIIHIILAAAFTSVICLVATSKSAIDSSLLASGVGYTAVAILAAVAAVDYRMSSKGDSAR